MIKEAIEYIVKNFEPTIIKEKGKIFCDKQLIEVWNGNPKLYKNKWDKLKFKQYFYLKIELEINFLKNYVF